MTTRDKGWLTELNSLLYDLDSRQWLHRLIIAGLDTHSCAVTHKHYSTTVLSLLALCSILKLLYIQTVTVMKENNYRSIQTWYDCFTLNKNR